MPGPKLLHWRTWIQISALWLSLELFLMSTPPLSHPFSSFPNLAMRKSRLHFTMRSRPGLADLIQTLLCLPTRLNNLPNPQHTPPNLLLIPILLLLPILVGI